MQLMDYTPSLGDVLHTTTEIASITAKTYSGFFFVSYIGQTGFTLTHLETGHTFPCSKQSPIGGNFTLEAHHPGITTLEDLRYLCPEYFI